MSKTLDDVVLSHAQIEQQIVRAENMQRDGWDMSVAIQAFKMALRAIPEPEEILARNALEGDRTELQAKIGHLEQKTKELEEKLARYEMAEKELPCYRLLDGKSELESWAIYAEKLRARLVKVKAERDELKIDLEGVEELKRYCASLGHAHIRAEKAKTALKNICLQLDEWANEKINTGQTAPIGPLLANIESIALSAIERPTESAAAQSSTAEPKAAPSQEGVGQGDAAPSAGYHIVDTGQGAAGMGVMLVKDIPVAGTEERK